MTGTAALSVCQKVCSHKCQAFRHSEREKGVEGERRGREGVEREDTCFHVSVFISFIIASMSFCFVRVKHFQIVICLCTPWRRRPLCCMAGAAGSLLREQQASHTVKELAQCGSQHPRPCQHYQGITTKLWSLATHQNLASELSSLNLV